MTSSKLSVRVAKMHISKMSLITEMNELVSSLGLMRGNLSNYLNIHSSEEGPFLNENDREFDIKYGKVRSLYGLLDDIYSELEDWIDEFQNSHSDQYL